MQSDKEVQKYTDALLGAIKNSQAYTDYAAAREEILKYPDRKQKADQFRRENYIARNYSGDEAAGMREKLYRQRQQLRLDPVADRYLNAELVLCRLLKNSALQILNVADLDLSGMDDIL